MGMSADVQHEKKKQIRPRVVRFGCATMESLR
jgi:hypothetical protein